MTAIIAQIERFAPGFRDRVVGQMVSATAQFAASNPNFVGRDIMTGAKDIRQLLFGPRITLSRIALVCRACTSAQPPRHPVPVRTVCAAPTPPEPHRDNSALRDSS
jgi:hypothetical protein